MLFEKFLDEHPKKDAYEDFARWDEVIEKGFIFIPALFILKAAIGADGLIWAQPVADVLSLVIVILMLGRKIRKTDFTKPCDSKQENN